MWSSIISAMRLLMAPRAAERRLEDIRAGTVLAEGAQDALQLPDEFFGAVDEVQLLAGGGSHFLTYPTHYVN